MLHIYPSYSSDKSSLLSSDSAIRMLTPKYTRIGIASFWMVFDFPDEAHFLSDDDRQRVLRRLKADQQSSAEHEAFKMEYFWATIKDWKTWLYAAIYMGGPLPSSIRSFWPHHRR